MQRRTEIDPILAIQQIRFEHSDALLRTHKMCSRAACSKDWQKGASIQQLPNDDRLRHYLGDHIFSIRGDKVRDRSRLSVELRVFDHLRERVGAGQAFSVQGLMLNAIGPLTDGRVTGFRSQDVMLAGGEHARPVWMPSAPAARGLVSRLEFLGEAGTPGCDLAKGIVALVGVLNAHPFLDGNGRLSRLIFNAFLRRAYPAAPYVDLYSFMYFAGGAFELSLREAEIFGDWTKVVGFLLACVDESAAQILRVHKEG